MTCKYRVHPDLQYRYSDIGEFIGKGYTNKPLRNDELVEILNSQDQRIKDLEAENKCGKCKFFMINGIKEYSCTYNNCKLQGYGSKACNAFEKWSD